MRTWSDDHGHDYADWMTAKISNCIFDDFEDLKNDILNFCKQDDDDYINDRDIFTDRIAEWIEAEYIYIGYTGNEAIDSILECIPNFIEYGEIAVRLYMDFFEEGDTEE